MGVYLPSICIAKSKPIFCYLISNTDFSGNLTQQGIPVSRFGMVSQSECAPGCPSGCPSLFSCLLLHLIIILGKKNENSLTPGAIWDSEATNMRL